jgi:hypothetical protein
MNLTFSTLAAKVLQQRDADVSLTGFAGTMRRLLAELEGDADYVDEIWHHNRPRFIPDAFSLNRKKQEILVYEIEDTHLLSLPKLGRMMAFYWWLEYHHWTMRVLIANRYGKVTNEVDLLRYFYASESPDVRAGRADVLTRSQLRDLQKLDPLKHEKFIERCLKENKRRLTSRQSQRPHLARL